MDASPGPSPETLQEAQPARRAATLVPILANPFSGSGPNRKYVDRLVAALEKGGLEPRTVWDLDERRALLSDPQIGERCRCVVSAGGDGSLADVVNDLAAAHGGPPLPVPLATLPMGNENLFARQFGFTRDAGKLAGAIVEGRTRQIDVGAVGDRLFTLMASAGFDADVVHRMARWRADAGSSGGGSVLRRVNRLSYAGRIMSAMAGYDYPLLEVEVDGQTVRGTHVFVFNIPQYGGNLGIAPDADAADSLLDWVVFERPGLVHLADYAWTVLRAKHLGRPDVPHGKAARLVVRGETPVPMQADGDPARFTPVEVKVCARALEVVDVGRG